METRGGKAEGHHQVFGIVDSRRGSRRRPSKVHSSRHSDNVMLMAMGRPLALLSTHRLSESPVHSATRSVEGGPSPPSSWQSANGDGKAARALRCAESKSKSSFRREPRELLCSRCAPALCLRFKSRGALQTDPNNTFICQINYLFSFCCATSPSFSAFFCLLRACCSPRLLSRNRWLWVRLLTKKGCVCSEDLDRHLNSLSFEVYQWSTLHLHGICLYFSINNTSLEVFAICNQFFLFFFSVSGRKGCFPSRTVFLFLFLVFRKSLLYFFVPVFVTLFLFLYLVITADRDKACIRHRYVTRIWNESGRKYVFDPF